VSILSKRIVPALRFFHLPLAEIKDQADEEIWKKVIGGQHF